ncbi:MAG TPA: hypothetical protein VIL10_05295 [Marmoricola sp.]
MHEDARAERAILSHAEAYRIFEEAREQRERAEAAEAEVERLRTALRDLLALAETELIPAGYRDADVPLLLADPVLRQARGALGERPS